MEIIEIKFVILILATLFISNSEGTPEEVWVQTLRPDLRSRFSNQNDKGFSELFVSLKRGTDTIKLKLEENVQINANAPLYELVTSLNGEQTIMKKDTPPITDVWFYQDREHTGTFTVTCMQEGPYCKHLLSGNLYIDGVNYDIYPSPDESARTFRNWIFGQRHILIRQDANGQLKQFLRQGNLQVDGLRVPQEMFRGLALEKDEQVEDGLPLPPGTLRSGEDLENDILNLWKQRILKAKQRQTNSKTRYTIECFIVMDPPLWEQHYEEVNSTMADDTDEAKDAATEKRLRQYFAHILNGVDLRYMSIQDPDMEIFLTLSGFLIVKERGENNPYNSSKVVIGSDGTEFAEAYEFVESVQSWVNRRIARRNNDHVFVFTGYTLFDGSTNSTSVIGLAYVGGVCSSFRTSINQEHGYNYWLMASLAAHELGHNLGASHDVGQNISCQSSDRYVMAPSVSSSLNPSQYRINPFRFSNCSIGDLKRTFLNLDNNCLLDVGDYYNETAYNIHVSNLPGEIYNLTEQCKLLQGDDSTLCSSFRLKSVKRDGDQFTDMLISTLRSVNKSRTDEGICSRLWCGHTDGFCYAFAAAPGSPCGQPNSNQWCFEGLCQLNPNLGVTTQTTATDISSTRVNDVSSTTSAVPSTEATSTSTESITSTTEILPTSSETLPSTSATIPSTSATIPSTTESIPSTSETLPSSSETVPTTSESLPSSSETIPTSESTSSSTETSSMSTLFSSTSTESPVSSTEDPNCVDKGFGGCKCDEMQLWYRNFDQYCRYTREHFCCATCRDRKIACEDFGFAGFSCSTLRYWSRSYASFCNSWRRYCCITCSNS